MSKKRKLTQTPYNGNVKIDPDIPPLRIVILVPENDFVIRCLIPALKNAGHQVMTVEFELRGDTQYFPELEQDKAGFVEKLLKFGPHFILCVNGQGFDSHQVIKGVAESEGIPLVIWFADSPTHWFKQSLSPEMARYLILTYDKEHVSLFRSMGYQHVQYMPLAVNPEDFPPVAESFQPDLKVGYAGKLFTNLQLMIEKPLYEAMGALYPGDSREYQVINSIIHDGIQKYREFDTPARSVFDWVEKQIQERVIDPKPLYSPVPPHSAIAYYLAPYIAHTASGKSRAALAQALLPQGIEVWGEGSWSEHLPAERCHLGVPYKYITNIYNRCMVNLSISHKQNLGSVTLRLFDVPASGNFLITDWRPCMSELFEIDEELIVFHSIEEAVDLVEKYNKDLEARKRIIQAARHRVLSEHTYLHRVESLVRVVIDIWPDIAERPRRRKKTHSHSPDHVSSPLIGALASYLLQGNKEKTAQAFLDEIEKRDGTESLNHMLNAQRAYDQEDYQTAFQECIAAIDAGDHSAHAFFSAGSAALLAEGPRESIPYFLKAAQIDPDSPRNWNCAGRSFLQIEDWAHAKSAIQKALGCNPQYPHAHQCWQAFSDVLLPAQADDDFSDFQLPDAPNS